jgi:hypothetical protein
MEDGLRRMESRVGYAVIPLDTPPLVEDPGLSGQLGASLAFGGMKMKVKVAEQGQAALSIRGCAETRSLRKDDGLPCRGLIKPNPTLLNSGIKCVMMWISRNPFMGNSR